MSADNWTTCPGCTNRIKNIEKLKNGYGKLSEKEYLELREQMKKITEDDSLRENYEIGISDNKFSVSYHAYCEECGFKYTYSYEKKIGG